VPAAALTSGMALIAALDKEIPHASGRRLWLLTRLAFLLFAVAVGALLWFSHRADIDERRATLISDMLWLEQDLRFVLLRNEELLGRLGLERSDSATRFGAGAQPLLGNDSGLRQIFWLTPEGRIGLASPNASQAHLVGEELDAVPSMGSFRLARSVGKPSYSTAYPIVQGDWQFEVHIPVFVENRFKGVVVGIYSLRRLLDQSIPWWLAERYRIAVVHYDGQELVSRSKISPIHQEADYQLAFDPPGHGLSLRAVAYRPAPALVGRILNASLVVLAVAVLWCLWALRQHIQRRQLAENALRNEYAFRQAMENSMHTGMRARDLSGRIIYVNPAFCRMVGWSAEELIDRLPPMPYWVDEEVEVTRRLHDQILAGDGPDTSFELRLKRRNGEVFTALIHEAPLTDSTGRRLGWMGSVIDISDRKHAEEQSRRQLERLQATSRLVAMGEMASSLAHELNQPLAAISSYCTAGLNMARGGQPANALVSVLEKAVEQAQRAGKIIRRIYAGVRRSDGRMEPLQLDRCVDTALSLIMPDLRRQDIRLDVDYAAHPMIVGDHVLLQQAVFNLLRNAADAMQGAEPGHRLLNVRLIAKEGYAELSVSDSGSGVQFDLADRLFDPLFTTKPEGLGMGLAICRSVVENHRGRLWFEARPERGTCFHVLLPLAEP